MASGEGHAPGRAVLLYCSEDDDKAYRLRGDLEECRVSIVKAETPGTPKTELGFTPSCPDHHVILWTKQALEDSDFLLQALLRERQQVEQRNIKCINVLFEEIDVAFMKQPDHRLDWFGKDVGPELAKKITDIMGDKNHRITTRVGNVSEGLVWNYFVVYLRKVLPAIKERVNTWRENPDNAGRNISDKFYLVIPKSGICRQVFKEQPGMDPECCESVGKVDTIKTHDAGIQDRVFNPNIYRVRESQDTQEWTYFVGEYANPVNTLHLLEKEYKQISTAEKHSFIEKFERRLRYVLSHPHHNLKGTFNILPYDDEDETQPQFNVFMAQKVKEDLVSQSLQAADINA